MKARLDFYAEMRERERNGEDIEEELVDAVRKLDDKKKAKRRARQKRAEKKTKVAAPGFHGSGNVTRKNSTCNVVTNESDIRELASRPDESKAKTTLDDVDMHNAVRGACKLSSLGMSNCQLGYMAGHGMAQLLNNNKKLTALDASENALGHAGGMAISFMIEKLYGIEPKDLFMRAVRAAEEEDYEDPAVLKRRLYTNLISLNLRRNGLGPSVVGNIMSSLSYAHCTLVDVDLSDNPLGFTIEFAGKAEEVVYDIRAGMSMNQVCTYV
jgi:hypothetical protein